jgi:hypothetical protein
MISFNKRRLFKLNGARISGNQNIPLDVNSAYTLDFFLSTGVNSYCFHPYSAETGGFDISVPFAPAPLPSSGLLAGSVLSLVSLWSTKKRYSRTRQTPTA